MLNDDEISCEWPTAHPSTTPIKKVFCTSLIKLAQLISLVTQRTCSVEAFRQPPQVLVTMVADLDRRKSLFEDFMQQYLSLDTPTGLPVHGSGLDVQQGIYIRLMYYILISAIHTILTNPWSRSALNFKDCPDAKQQVEHSTEVVAKASRDAILAFQYIVIDATTPIL
jgi:hypothetical protein